MKTLHPYARVQWYLFIGWAVIWLIGAILPGSLGSLVLRLRDLIFLLFSLVTLWMGWRMWTLQGLIVSQLLIFFSGILRKAEGSRSASVFLRRLHTQQAMRTQGSIHMLVGAMCAFTTLVYLFIL